MTAYELYSKAEEQHPEWFSAVLDTNNPDEAIDALVERIQLLYGVTDENVLSELHVLVSALAFK